jgi:hypothetical protein
VRVLLLLMMNQLLLLLLQQLKRWREYVLDGSEFFPTQHVCFWRRCPVAVMTKPLLGQ